MNGKKCEFLYIDNLKVFNFSVFIIKKMIKHCYCDPVPGRCPMDNLYLRKTAKPSPRRSVATVAISFKIKHLRDCDNGLCPPRG